MTKEKSFRDVLLNSGITEPEEFLQSRVVDIYRILDTDKENLIEIFNEIADKINLPTGQLVNKKCEPYLFFDVFSDYYNDNSTGVSMALINKGFDSDLALSEITVFELLSIRGICSSNMSIFISKILDAHIAEYGY